MISRYSRQICIPEIGKNGQKKISDAKVLIIGCGALGSMVSMQLAGAGIGVLGIADFDTIDISNLQRQFFFTLEQAGESKVEIMAKRIRELNPEVKVESYKEMITLSKADIIFSEYDFIVDATDNPYSKRMTGTVSLKKNKPCCIGGVRDFSGQIMTLLPTDPRFEDYFGEAGADGFLPCSLGGVIGPAASICASIQASEVIKYFTGAGNLLTGKLLLFNLLFNSFKSFTL